MTAMSATPSADPPRSFDPTLLLVPAVAALGIAFGVTVLLVTVFNYLIEPISRDLDLTRAQTAGALSVHLGTLIVALPAAGALADRFGVRRVVVASAVMFGFALLWLSHVTGGIAPLYVAFGLAGAAGAGVSPVSFARVIVHRFSAHRGLALGIALTGTGLGGILLPAIVRPIVLEHGWRDSLQVLAIIASVVGVSAGLLVGNERGRHAVLSTGGYTLREAMGFGAFWRMTLAFALLGATLAGVISHLTGIWEALGLDPEYVPAFQAKIGVATIVGRLAGGALMDRVPAHWVGAGAALAGAGGLALLAGGAGGDALLLMLVAIAIGTCTGAESDVISFLSSRYFGLGHFAKIYAVQGSFFMIGFALGPVLAAHAFERAGAGYALMGGAVFLVGSAAVLASLRAPPHHS